MLASIDKKAFLTPTRLETGFKILTDGNGTDTKIQFARLAKVLFYDKLICEFVVQEYLETLKAQGIIDIDLYDLDISKYEIDYQQFVKLLLEKSTYWL